MGLAVTEVRQDEFAGKLPVHIPTDTIRRLSVLTPTITLRHVATEWAIIFALIWVCTHYWNPLLYLAVVVFLGSRQHALGVLMHEGAHYRIFKNKQWNDWFSDVFLAWPILITTASYRSNHAEHHKYTNSEKDPDCHRKLFDMDRRDWEFPIQKSRLALSFLKDLTAVSAFHILRSLFMLSRKAAKVNQKSSALPKILRLGFYLSILACSIAFGFWKGLILFWFVPYLTTFNLLLHVRSIAEHFATENDQPLNITRTTIATWWERIFFPKNINYHIDHHLYPSVPFYRLRELHQVLMEQPAFRERAHITETYFGVLKECVRVQGFRKTCLPTRSPMALVSEA